MAISTGMAILGAAGIGGIGSALGASSGNRAATRAAETQADAATEAARIQAEGAREALGFQREVYTDQRNMAAPTTRAGAAARARQMVMAGVSPEEAQQYYRDTVSALANPPAMGGAPGQGGSGAGAQGGVDWQSYAKTQPDVAAALANPNSDFAKLYAKEGQGKDPYQFHWERYGQAERAGSGYTLPTLASSAQPATPTGSVTGTEDSADDLGDLSQWAPQTFEFDTQDVYEDPGYQFRRDEGEKALQRTAAAQGKFFSGALGKGLTRYNQDYASGEFDKAYGRSWNEFNLKDTTKWNRLGTLSGLASEGTNLITDAGSDFGDNASSLTMTGANATANGINAAGGARASGYGAQQNPLAAGVGGALGAGISYMNTAAWMKKPAAGVTVRR